MFWWWGNVFMALWTGVTVIAGITYADGKAVNGPLALLGRVFDGLFGLDTCRKIPGGNQNLGNLKNPCYFCSTGGAYPHADHVDFVVNHASPPDVFNCTGVSGVGGINGSHMVSGAKSAVDPVQFITTVFTGSPTGSIAKGDYDKKRFKHGTPYPWQQTGKTFGYYYTTDDKGQEIPIIPPAIGTTTIPPALAANPTAYGGDATTGYMPPGCNGWIRYPNGTTGMAFTPHAGQNTYTNPVKSSTFDPLLGIVNGVSSSAQANIDFIQGPLSFIEKLKYKSFSPATGDGAGEYGMSGASHPRHWDTRGQ